MNQANSYTLCGAAVAASIVTVMMVAGCATESAPVAAPAGSTTVLVQIQPARIPPNPQGAFALSTVTGCNVTFLGQAAGTDTFRYAVAPTSRMPDVQQCIASLRTQPGVLAVSAAQ